MENSQRNRGINIRSTVTGLANALMSKFNKKDDLAIEPA